MVAKVADALGYSLMPWQELVLDVGLETEESTGRFSFKDVVLSTPRQSGKSILLLALIVWRMVSEPDVRIVYGAQSRLAARVTLFDNWWPKVARSPFGEMFELGRATGTESLRCSNGSIMSLLSTEVSSGHGQTLDLVVCDECWTLPAHVEQALRPTLATRPNSQFWAASTAGAFESTWFRGKVDSGRVASQLDIGTGAYFEWSAGDDADVSDPDGWADYMPALGRTIDHAAVQASLESMSIEEFARAFGNRWAHDSADLGWNLIPRDVWRAARLDDES